MSIEDVNLKKIHERMMYHATRGRTPKPDVDRDGIDDALELWWINKRLISQLLGLKANGILKVDICRECADQRWSRPCAVGANIEAADWRDYNLRQCTTCNQIRPNPEASEGGE